MAKAEIVLGELSGGGGGSSNILATYSVFSGGYYMPNYINEDILTKVSGDYATDVYTNSIITFSSKVSGDMTFVVCGGTNNATIEINGVQKAQVQYGSQTVTEHISVGDTIKFTGYQSSPSLIVTYSP